MHVLSDTKIPFAKDKRSGQLVDVGEVSRGAECGCQCPSCDADMVAKQGEVNVWHFAHAPHVKDDTKQVRVCEYSPLTAIRLMCIQVLQEATHLMLPAVPGAEGRHAKQNFLNLSGAKHVKHILGVPVDFGFRFDNASELGICIIGASAHPALGDRGDKKTAFLGIDAHLLNLKIASSDKGQYTEALCSLLRDSDEVKVWLYHPKAKDESEAVEEVSAISEALYQLGQSSKIQETASPQPARTWHCVYCDARFTQVKPYCKDCNTHLYCKEDTPD